MHCLACHALLLAWMGHRGHVRKGAPECMCPPFLNASYAPDY